MKSKIKKLCIILISLLTASAATATFAGCGAKGEPTENDSFLVTSGVQSDQSATEENQSKRLSESDITVNDTISNDEDGGHAIVADDESLDYSKVFVTKTGNAEGDEADFYGENAAILAENGGALTLSSMVVKSDGEHANGVFCCGDGSEINISDSYIKTEGNFSGGIMTTGGGTMNAKNLTIETSGDSSAAIRSDRGGGTVNVSGGYYSTSGTGSPVIYSTADITVSDAEMVSAASQGVVVEGKNSVTLNNVTLTADNNTHNSDKTDYFQAVMIYQSMSGDAEKGLSAFSMNGGKLVNKNGDVFFVNNTSTEINLDNVSITNEGDGVFLRAAASGWGTPDLNGGQVVLNASNQTITGNILVDDISTLNLYLKGYSGFTGAINPTGYDGEVYVELEKGSTWSLTADSYISALTCTQNSIKLNGHKLYVDGKEYSEGKVSQGSEFFIDEASSAEKQEATSVGEASQKLAIPQEIPTEGSNPDEDPHERDGGDPHEKGFQEDSNSPEMDLVTMPTAPNR